MADQWQKGEFLISTDKVRLDLEVIHDFLANQSYWAQGRDLEVVKRGIENSLNFGVYHGDRQIGFARVVTDYATFAWLADVFVLEDYRRQGLGKWLIAVILSHPRLQGFAAGTTTKTHTNSSQFLDSMNSGVPNAGWNVPTPTCARPDYCRKPLNNRSRVFHEPNQCPIRKNLTDHSR